METSKTEGGGNGAAGVVRKILRLPNLGIMVSERLCGDVNRTIARVFYSQFRNPVRNLLSEVLQLAKINLLVRLRMKVVLILSDCRRVLLPVILSHVDALMSCPFELQACIKILSDIMDLMFKTDVVVSIQFTLISDIIASDCLVK